MGVREDGLVVGTSLKCFCPGHILGGKVASSVSVAMPMYYRLRNATLVIGATVLCSHRLKSWMGPIATKAQAVVK